MQCEVLFRFVWGGCSWGEVFVVWGGRGFLQGAAVAPDWWAGCAGSVYAFCKCRLIPPHQSLTRQLPPEGKPSFRCANIANKISGSNRITNINRRPNSCISFLLYKTERNFEKASPLGGKKTASSLSRQRLMRGDKSPPKQRVQNLTRSTRQRSAASRPIGGVDRRILKSPQKTLRTLWGATKNGK